MKKEIKKSLTIATCLIVHLCQSNATRSRRIHFYNETRLEILDASSGAESSNHVS